MSTLAPIVYGYVEDANDTTSALTGDKSKLIKYYSDAYVQMSATPQNSDTAIDQDMYIIRNGNNTITDQSGTFYNVESNEFRFSAQDSDGNIGTAIVTVDMINYIKLTCNSTQNRLDADGKITVACSGKFFNQSFGAESNTLTVQFRYAQYGNSPSNWINMIVQTNGNKYSAKYDLSGLNYQLAYTFEMKATDKLMTAECEDTNVSSKPLFHWGETDFQFNVPVFFNDTSETTIRGDLRLKGEKSTYGNAIYFGNSTNAYIKENPDNILTIYSANGVNLTSGTNSVKIQGKLMDSGTWTPYFKDISSYVEYETRNGWYQKFGSVVTIGWIIKANITESLYATNVEIQGAPLYPICSAFGGGVAYNVYTSYGNVVFEGWSIDTNKIITARVQPIENAAGNFQIASFCGYPMGGGQITVAGTICYMTS